MGGEWKEMTWGDLATLEYGKGLRGYQEATGRYRVYGTNGPIGWHDEPLCPFPSVIVGRKGAYRGIHYSPEPFFVIDTAFYLNPKKDLDIKWAYYELLTHDINSMDSGSAIPSTNRQSFYALRVLVPSLPEQRAIARILGALDDKIELNRRMNETLEAMAQALFKSWFVDFDPVVVNALRAGSLIPEKFADRAAHYRDNPHALCLPEDILRLFPARFVDSELGPIPEGWEVKAIGELVKCVGGATPSTRKPEFWESGTNPFLTPKDMASLDAHVVLDTERHITDAGVERISSKRLPAGTVLLSSRAPIGYLAINQVPVSINQGIIAMICGSEVSNCYIFLWAKNNMDLVKGKAGGTTFAEISKRNFRPIRALKPSKPALETFTNIANTLFSQIVENVRVNRTLASLRDTLLPKLISGELRVPDVEKILEGIRQ